jgi:AcrR family transcriptional regulator
MTQTRLTRKRRSPEEARQLILASAQKRLIEFGIRGLTVKDIAAETQINHGTLLHHFGSAEGMRNALLEKMTSELIAAMGEVISTQPAPQDSVAKLFELMNETGHIKLLAWRAMEEQKSTPKAHGDNAVGLGNLIQRLTAELSDHDQARARNMVQLVVSAAVGWGICADGFQSLFGVTPTQQEAFPSWVGEQMARLAVTDSD